MKRSRLAPSGKLRRPYRLRQRRRRFLIYCEGEVTEPAYLLDIRNYLRSPLIDIVIGPKYGRDPKGLVELAIAHRARARRQARLEGDENLLYDEVWCVCDVDEHRRLPDARQQARAHSIELAISNPCIELWFLLHFSNRSAYIERKAAQSALKARVPGYEKEIDFSVLKGKCGKAKSRAEQLDARAARIGDQYGNPTTGMWRLVARLCDQAHFPVDAL